MARVRVIGDLWHGRVPDDAVYIGRAAPGLPRSVFANPHPVDKPCRPCGGLVHDRPGAVEAYRAGLTPELVARARVEIGDADVACWCGEDEPCHGDPLLEAMTAAGWVVIEHGNPVSYVLPEIHLAPGDAMRYCREANQEAEAAGVPLHFTVAALTEPTGGDCE